MKAQIPLHPAMRLPDKKPFTIGIAPLDRSRWIEPDAKLSAELALKQELFTHDCSDVFRAEQHTHQSQLEMRDALIAFLTTHHPQLYHRDRHIIRVNEQPIALSDEPPLLTASRLVQDDLCIMRSITRRVAAGGSLPVLSLDLDAGRKVRSVDDSDSCASPRLCRDNEQSCAAHL